MSFSRRDVIFAGGAASVAALAPRNASALAPNAPAVPPALPDRTSFVVAPDMTYLDSGSQHPASVGSAAAAAAYVAHRSFAAGSPKQSPNGEILRAKFARLINAPGADDIAFVQSTTTGEQIVLRGLGFPDNRAHVVSDTLHFFGSLPIYEELARQGCTVTWVRDRNGRITLEDMRRAITPKTRLVSLSLVSTINGFEHDLKGVCDIAHANDALVYADIIHAAGCVPVDVAASGVDFAACASYKWLMGDFGLGFLYGSPEARSHLLRREYGYEGITKFDSHIYPFDPPGKNVADYAYGDTAEGRFAHGTTAFAVMAQLDHSLSYIEALGIPAIQAHAQDLTDLAKKGLLRLGHRLMTPLEARTPLVACALENAREKLGSRMAAANVRITTSRNRFRISPSVFNDERDIERFLSVLGRA
jgi:selenocysteine lyase/cysteine desulfurase